MPERIQLKRVKGWRMPANTVVVTRGPGKKWGNPFVVCSTQTPQQAVDAFRRWLQDDLVGQEMAKDARRKLRGKNLACWCKPGAPCHADVLLEIANG